MKYHQPKLDFGESAEAEREIDRRCRAERAAAFERAAERLGMRPNEIGFKLAGMLGVYVNSPSMRARGVTGLKWTGTTQELADDARLKCSVDSVSKVLRRFRAAGYIETRQTVDDRGRVNGIEIELQMRAIALDSGPGSYPGTDPGNGPGTDPGKSTAYYIPFIPSYPKEPPPPSELTKTESQTAGAGAVCLDDWKQVESELAAVGVRRVRAAVTAAIDAKLTPPAVFDILGQYRANRSRFDDAGAIFDRIRSGSWPVDIPDVQTLERAAAAKDARRREFELEKARSEIIRRARADGTWATLSDADIEAAARRLLDSAGRVAV